MGGSPHGGKVAGSQKPGRQRGCKKEARRRQALENKLGGFQNVGAASSVRKGPGKVGIGECILDLAGGNLTVREWLQKGVHGQARLQGWLGLEGKMGEFPSEGGGQRRQ